MSKTETKREALASQDEGISLNIILKFIKTFNGDRERLTAFLRDCDSAIALASPQQENIIFRYILSQLEGKAETACSIKDFDSWPSLKEFLKNQFGERKHYAHLLTDLQDCRQGFQEIVSHFSLRVESCLQKLLTEVTISNTKKTELPGRLAAMEDLALHTFVMGLHPRIANIVRCREPKTLNQAINYAISEEKIQQFSARNNPNKTKPIESYPKKNYNNNNASLQRPNHYNNRTPSIPNKDLPFCRYCKNVGHVLEHCKIRESNNKRFANGSQLFTPLQPSSSNFKPSPRVNYTDTQDEEEGKDEADEPINHLNE